MTGSASSPYRGWAGTIATMHGKEAVIPAAFLERHGLHLIVSRGLDTDVFGTFSDVAPSFYPVLSSFLADVSPVWAGGATCSGAALFA